MPKFETFINPILGPPKRGSFWGLFLERASARKKALYILPLVNLGFSGSARGRSNANNKDFQRGPQKRHFLNLALFFKKAAGIQKKDVFFRNLTFFRKSVKNPTAFCSPRLGPIKSDIFFDKTLFLALFWPFLGKKTSKKAKLGFLNSFGLKYIYKFTFLTFFWSFSSLL